MQLMERKKMVSDSQISTSNVAKITGVTMKQLYYWEERGIIDPKFEKFGNRLFRRFQNSDVELIHRIKCFLNEGYTLKKAAEKAKSGH